MLTWWNYLKSIILVRACLYGGSSVTLTSWFLFGLRVIMDSVFGLKENISLIHHLCRPWSFFNLSSYIMDIYIYLLIFQILSSVLCGWCIELLFQLVTTNMIKNCTNRIMTFTFDIAVILMKMKSKCYTSDMSLNLILVEFCRWLSFENDN